MNIRRSYLRSQRGLTLVEIIVVLVILSILIGFLTGGLFKQSGKAKAKINAMQMERVKQSIGQYQLMYNQFPPSLEALATCPDAGTACVPISDADSLKDAWGTPYVYSVQNGGRGYLLRSLGADKAEGGTDVDGDPSITGP